MTPYEHLRRLDQRRRLSIRRHALVLRRVEGFGSIEAIAALGIFLVIATSLVGLLTSSISLQSLARQRTVAEQAAMDQVEKIRQLPYASVGTLSGNPPGTVVGSTPISVTGLAATLQTQIAYVNDPTPTSYATSANYKRVTVSVRRSSDNKILTRQTTYIAPLARAPLGGINNAVINVSAIDIGAGINVPAVGATVNLGTGPSAPRSDTADDTGNVTFAALTPSGAGYYDLTAALLGYETLPEDLPGATGSPNHLQVGPGQTRNTAIRIYKPAQIDVLVKNADTTLHTGPVNVEISSSRQTEIFTVTGGTQAITTLGPESVIPGLEYTVTARTDAPNPLCSVPETRYVPDAGYPTVTSSTFSLTLQPCPVGTIHATVTWAGTPVDNATVDILGGPNNVSIPGLISGLAPELPGEVTVPDVPEGGGYTVQVTFGGNVVTQTVSVIEAQTTEVAVALPVASTLTVHVRRNSSFPNVGSATVELSGGPMSRAPVLATTNSSGNATFTNLPAGSGYLIRASKCSGSPSGSLGEYPYTNHTVSNGTPTINITLVTIVLPCTP